MLLPFALFLTTATDWKEWNDRGLAAQRQGNYAEARALFEQAAQRAGDDSLLQARSWNNLGAVLYLLGRHAEAESAYRRALREWEHTEPAGGIEYATCRVNLSVLLRQRGQLEAAESEAEAAIRLLAASGANGSAVASGYHGLAETHRLQGRWDAAAADLRRAETALRGERNPVLSGHLMQTEGTLWQDRGHPEFAEPFHRAARRLFEKALGPAHPHTAAAAVALGQTLLSLERWQEGEDVLRGALESCEAAHGPAHVRTAAAVNNLAQLLRATGRYAEAEPLYRRSIEVFQSSLGPGHPDVAKVIVNLADLFVRQGKYRGAESLYRDALRISEAGLGAKHRQVGVVLQRLADLLRSQHRTVELRRVQARLAAEFEATSR
jgi:tetratricopeptide (TPR) repeat protein